MARKGLNIYKRKDGRWEGRVRVKGRNNSYMKYKSIYGKTYKETKEKTLLYIQMTQKNLEECPFTVECLLEQWLQDRRHVWKESTYACYRQIICRHILPFFAKRRAEDITNVEFNHFLSSICRKSDGSKISGSYLHSIARVMIQAYRYTAQEYGYMLPSLSNTSPAKKCKAAIIPNERDMQVLEAYLRAHLEDSTCAGILLTLYTGIRIGELCALTWEDIDLEEGTLHIRKSIQRVKNYDNAEVSTRICVQEPKTLTSNRLIPLPNFLTALLKGLQRESSMPLIQGKRKEWAEARTVQYRFSTILKECGIPHFKFHMLRHYFASMCIRQGFDVKSLSEILGHSNVQITLNFYVHSTTQQKRSLMNRLGKKSA